MSHVLNKIIGAPLEAVKQQLEKDAEENAKKGMFLEHLWQNDENPNEVFFLFKVKDLDQCKRVMKKVYEQARQINPEVKLPEKIFLKEI